MFEILKATKDNVVAVRMGDGTPAGYREFYDLLVEKTDEFGTVHVYEETIEWTLSTYLSHLHGVVPDLRTGSKFDIGRYATVGDSRWAKLLYYQWRAIAPVWPVSPDEMRYYGLSKRDYALDWVMSTNPTK
ncbi:SpoIIAA family protein [Halostagnicola kamekurae]|nr:STAS/SEC14 domain-containing protein [Halostagnicola kamekurae]